MTGIGTEDIKTKIIENLTKNYHVFFHPKMAVYYNKLFKIILGNILQYTTIYYNFSSENNFRKFLGQMNGNFWRAYSLNQNYKQL